MTHKISWIDHGREPKCQPDPEYPTGKDVGCVEDGQKSCKVDLPYPAKRCGVFIVECETCKVRVAVTTAGRPDDPRSLTMPCAALMH